MHFWKQRYSFVELSFEYVGFFFFVLFCFFSFSLLKSPEKETGENIRNIKVLNVSEFVVLKYLFDSVIIRPRWCQLLTEKPVKPKGII